MAKASDQIVEKGRRIAARLLEAAEADLEFVGPRFRVKGTDRSVDLFEAARVEVLDGLSDETMPQPSFPYGTAVCEVEWIPRPAWSSSCGTPPSTTAAAPSTR